MEVLRQFRLIFSAVRSHFREVEKRSGIGGAQVWALSVIHQRPTLTVSELALAMDVHQSTASNLVKGLVSHELIRTDRDEVDRRSVRLRILPAGKAVLRKVPRPFSGVLPAALNTLDSAVLNRMQGDLASLIVALEADSRAARKPLAEM